MIPACTVGWGAPVCPFTVIIKAVCDLVPDHHPDAPEIQGLWLVLAEEGWLENPCWKDCPPTTTPGDKDELFVGTSTGTCHLKLGVPPAQRTDKEMLRYQTRILDRGSMLFFPPTAAVSSVSLPTYDP